MSDITKHSDDEFYWDASAAGSLFALGSRRRACTSNYIATEWRPPITCGASGVSAGVRTLEQAEQLVAQIVKAGRGTSQLGLTGICRAQ